MGIRRLEISGFRSLADVVWEPGPLNLVIGVNGSGKSNLLRALELLRAAAEGRLSETVRRMGGMVPLLWDGQRRLLQLKLLMDLEEGGGARLLFYEMTLEQAKGLGTYNIASEQLSRRHRPSTQERFVFTRDHDEIHWEARQRQSLSPLEIPTKHESALSQLFVDASNTQLSLYLRGQLSNLGVYHDVRMDSDSEARRATIARLEHQVDPDGSNLTAVLHTLYSGELAFRAALDSAMRAAFGDEFDELIFPPAEDGRVQLRLRWRSLKRAQSAADLSDGTLRFLFLITVLANPTPPSLIAIDEPETGLHPSMFPIIAEHAVEASKRTQVILTTHSPQFLNAFSEYPDITTVAELHEGKTALRRLPADKLAKWLEHYQLGELMMSGELETMD